MGNISYIQIFLRARVFYSAYTIMPRAWDEPQQKVLDLFQVSNLVNLCCWECCSLCPRPLPPPTTQLQIGVDWWRDMHY